MYISKITLHNFKGFKGDHEFNFDKGINFLVGNNNCGKSTLFQAIDFLQNGKNEEDYITKNLSSEDEYTSVAVEFSGQNISKLVEQEHLKKYKNYLINDGDNTKLLIMRSSKETIITQSGKEKTLSIKQIRVFNPKNDQFENPSGIDSTISALFDAQFVWADTRSDEVLDFSRTKICGRIIEKVVLEQVKDSWKEFQESHAKTFDKITESLSPIEIALQEKLAEQYGETKVNFQFTLPQISDFLKSGNIELTDDGIQTSSFEKGTGMQRSLALAIIQLYAEIVSSNDTDCSKPLFFFIDEPETFLHPKAQNKLLDSLESLSKKSQIFIVTHSPYLLKQYRKDTHSIWLFSKNNSYNEAKEGEELDLFGDSSPSWGEINYYAYGIPSVEFHNELYGFIQAKATIEDDSNYNEKPFDLYLKKHNKSLKQNKTYKRLKRDSSIEEYDVTLPTYIRNLIHHPENTNNPSYSDTELEESIKCLIDILKNP